MAQRGRPTKYTEDMVDKVDYYIEKESIDSEIEFHKTRGEKSDTYERVLTVKLPTIEGFASFIGVNKDSLYEWARKHEVFSVALEKIRVEQRNRLIDNGLSGNYNSTIAKLILSSNHGMKEKSDVTSDGKAVAGNTIVFKDFKKE